MKANPHVKAVPLSIQNFVTRTVIGRFWSSLLQVAEDVRDSDKRQLHKEAIAAKRELYDWIDQRVQVMLEKMEQQQPQNEA
jgi:hypothetical protein